MPPITNPEAIRFSNEEIRTAADDLGQLYARAKRVVDIWNARSMAGKITNGPDIIEDGSHPLARSPDGRPPITGAQATAIITRLMEFVADYEAGNKAKRNTVLQVAVNPSRG